MLGGITKAFRNHGWIRYDFYNIITRSYDSDIEEDADKILQEISSMARGGYTDTVYGNGKTNILKYLLSEEEC